MSLGLSTFLAPQSIVEKVPSQVLPSPVSAASVVVGRNRSRFIPTSGSTYSSGGQTIITFRISDTNAFLDLPTAVLHYRLNVPKAATANDCLPDDGPSWIARVRVSVGGSVLVEDVQDINVAVNASAYSQMPKETYCSAAGQYAGFWKLNDENYPNVQVTGGVNYVAYDQSARTRAQQAALYGGGATLLNQFVDLSGAYHGGSSGESTGVSSFAVPLGFLTGLGRINTLYPLRLTGALEIVIYLENKNTCLVASTAASAPATMPDYEVTDCTIECDTVALAPSVVAAMDSLGASSSESGGLMIPVDTLISNRVSYPSTGLGSRSFQISRGTTQLIALQEVHRTASDVTDKTKFSVSNFKNLDISRHQIRIGAALYPQTNSDSLARIFTESSHGAGRLNSLFPTGLMDRQHFKTDDADDTRFVYNYNFEQVRNEQIALQGISTLASGSVVQVDVTNNPSAISVMNVFLTSRRYIALNNSSVSVIGN